MSEVKFNNDEISEYIKSKLNKKPNDKVRSSDLRKLDTLVINGKDILGNKIEYNLQGIKNFANLESLTLKNIDITKKDLKSINKLRKIKKLVFINCNITEKAAIARSLRKLYIDRTQTINNVKFKRDINELQIMNITLNNEIVNGFKKIQKLTILSCDGLDDINLIKFKNITKFNLQNCNIRNIKVLSHFNRLKEINLDGTNVEEDYNAYSFIMDMDVTHGKYYSFYE